MAKKSPTKSTAKKKSTKKGGKTKAVNVTASIDATEEKPTLESLLNRKFEHWVPETPYRPELDREYENNFAAPPLNEKDGKAAKQIQSLLSRRFDLSAAKPDPAPRKTDKKTQKKESKPAAPKAEKKTPAVDKPKAAPKKPLTPGELIGRMFDTWSPETPYSPGQDNEYESSFAAPPAFEGEKGLLFKQFDLNVPDAPPEKPAPKAVEPAKAEIPVEAAPKKEPVPVETLLKQKFEIWTPAKPYSPEPDSDYEKNFAAPPAFEATDKSLLFKQFDLSVADTPPEPEPAEIAPTPEEKAPEAEIVPEVMPEPIPEPTPPIVAEPAAPTETTPPAAQAPPEPAAQAAPVVEATPEPAAEKAAEPVPAPAPPEKPESPKAVAAEKPVEKAAEKPKAVVGKEKPAVPPKPPVHENSGNDSGMPPQTPEPPTHNEEPSMNQGLKILIVSLGVIFGLVIAASISNMKHYYVERTDKGVEIWRGDFSPRGTHRIVSLHGAKAPEMIEEVLGREQALTLAFNYYMAKAADLSQTSGDLVDFKSIRDYLEEAREFAVTDAQRDMVISRLNEIDFMMLMYKADTSAGKLTEQGYEDALDFLKEAKALRLDANQKEQLTRKTGEFQTAYESLKKEKKVAPKVKAKPAAPTEKKTEESKPATDQKTPAPADVHTPPAHH